MLATLLLAAATSVPACWSIYDDALRTSAAGLHPQYVTYDESIIVTHDDRPWMQSTAFVEYRDDGVARVRDERFSFVPILTRHAEPGPPEIGPYGAGRDAWLPHDLPLPVIANVRAKGDVTCSVRDRETYKGHDTYQLRFTGARADRPHLEAMWVDARTNVVWKLIVSGYVNVTDENGVTPVLADFEVELGYTGPYLVVNHVVWELRKREYSQSTRYFGEYTMRDYAFPESLPDSYFTTATDLK